MVNPPFVFGRIVDKENFVDREADRERLSRNFRSLVNTTIISPRRWGKSSLVQKVAEDLVSTDPSVRVCMIDIFTVRSEAEFYAHLAHGVMKVTMTKWDEWVEAAHQFMSHLRPTVAISAGQTPEITLDVDWQKAQADPDEVLDLAEKIAESKRIQLVICVDEFQAIADFPDSVAFQRKLRSHWQQHQRVAYCLYGSKRHMLMDIFSNPDLPFFQFGDIMILEKIDNAIWGEFIAHRFADTGKLITSEQGRYIAALVDNHSYYVQQLAQQAWFRSDTVCTAQIIDAAMADLTNQLSLLFQGVVGSLTARQLGFLRAVVNQEPQLSSKQTILRYDLGTSANVQRIKESLVTREIIDVEGRDIQILDPVFKHWFLTQYL